MKKRIVLIILECTILVCGVSHVAHADVSIKNSVSVSASSGNVTSSQSSTSSEQKSGNTRSRVYIHTEVNGEVVEHRDEEYTNQVSEETTYSNARKGPNGDVTVDSIVSVKVDTASGTAPTRTDIEQIPPVLEEDTSVLQRTLGTEKSFKSKPGLNTAYTLDMHSDDQSIVHENSPLLAIVLNIYQHVSSVLSKWFS